jgi:hypothetical protein
MRRHTIAVLRPGKPGSPNFPKKSGPGFLFDAGSGFVLIFGHTA